MDLNFLGDNNRLLIKLLSAAIRGKEFSVENAVGSGIDWQNLFFEADKHQVLALLYPVIIDNEEELSIADTLLSKFKKSALIDATTQERSYAEIKSVLRGLSAAGIPVIVLKGLIIRDLYKYPFFRTMGDYDLLIKSDDMEAAGRILEESGYYFHADDEKEASYNHDSLPKIDLHRQLISTRKFENTDSFNTNAWLGAEKITVSGVQMLSLCPLDNAIFILFHTASHIISGGFGLRQLCDFTLFVECYRDKIDWDEYFSMAALLDIDVFARVLMEVCRRLLELEPPKCSQIKGQAGQANHEGQEREQELDEALVRSVIIDIFDAGVFGFSSDERIMSSRLLYYSSGQEVQTLRGRASMYFKLLLPPTGKLDVRYQYAKKHPILLPLAWLHRIIYCTFRRDIDFSEKTAVLTSHRPVTMYDSRVKMLRGLGLQD